MAYAVRCSLSDWTNEALMKQGPDLIEQSVTGWLESCEKIHEEFKVKYPAAANAAEVINGQVKDFSKNLNLVRCLSSSDI